MRKIDFFTHALTPRYLTELDNRGIRHHPTKPARILSDISYRMEVMDEFAPGDTSVVTMMGPDLESMVDDNLAVKLAQIGNEELAELCRDYPDYFIAAAGMLPMRNIKVAQQVCRRSIEELGLKGIQISSNILGEYLDSERLYPLYEMMEAYDLPIWIHPVFAPGPLGAPFDVALMLGWPMDTSMTMFYLAKSEVFDRFPRLKFVTHHCGAFIPAFYPRLKAQYFDNPDYLVKPVPPEESARHTNFRRFYTDTAIYGNCTNTLELGCRFFGVDHVLYGTDFPSMTPDELPQTIASVNRLPLSDAEKEQIFFRNALSLLHLA